MSDLSNANNEKHSPKQLAIRRAEFIKKLKIKVKSSSKTYDQDQLILIQTFNTQKNNSVQLVMRRLSQLDSLIAHMNTQYGGHIIPTFSHDLYYQESLKVEQVVPAIQEYLQDLRNNKYCRLDIKFYCFIIEQHTSFPKQMGLQRAINNATDASRKYLNQIFTRKALPKEKDTDVLLYAQKVLSEKIDQYYQIKQISLLKVKETLLFEQVTGLFTEMSAWPCIAIQPQQHDIDFIWRVAQSSQKLIDQAKHAFLRWEALVESVRQLQFNVYKGLHQYHCQLNEKNQQLKQWNDSLGREFHDLCDYLDDKMQALSGLVYKINSKFIDMTVFAGQCIKIDGQDDAFTRPKAKQELKQLIRQHIDTKQEQQIKLSKVPKLTSPNSFQINQEIQISLQLPPSLSKSLTDISDGPQSPRRKRVQKIQMPFESQYSIAGQDIQAGKIQGNQFEVSSKNKQEITCDDD